MEFIKLGKGGYGISLLLDDRLVSLNGLDRIPEAGDRLKICGEVWEIEGVTDATVPTMVEWVVKRLTKAQC